MPYRRLPNTDNARLRALKCAFTLGNEIPPFKLAFSQSTFQKVRSFLPSFENAIKHYKHCYSKQVNKNKDYINTQKKAKLFISHYTQVVNMAILRGEISPKIRKYYGIEELSNKIPSLNTETDIILWGEKIIQGESSRIMKGLSPITNPTIAVVKVRYEKFIESYKNQKELQKKTASALKELSIIRKEADEIIVNVWNEVECFYKDLPEDIRREKAKEYGLVYVFRKNEVGNSKLVHQSSASAEII